ncbi:MAG: sigma-70 family RNA polymerase sigma factor [Kofleriaceae bacterium]
MDEAELAALVRRHAGLLHKVAYAYCRNPADREDLLQEIALQLWRAHDRFDRSQRESTWIYRVALNVAISFYRRERRHRERTSSLEDAPEGAWLSLAAPEVSDEAASLWRGLAELAPLERSLALLYLDGLDHATIAEVLGLSPSNVGTKLGRIKERLRANYQRSQTQERSQR